MFRELPRRRALDPRKTALHFRKRALDLHKRALHPRKRALDLRNRALVLHQKALFLRKRAPDLQKRALDLRKRALDLQDKALDFRKRAPDLHKRASFGVWTVSRPFVQRVQRMPVIQVSLGLLVRMSRQISLGVLFWMQMCAIWCMRGLMRRYMYMVYANVTVRSAGLKRPTATVQ